MKYGPEYIVKPVRITGEISWKGKRIYISQVLAGERIGLLQMEDEKKWEIRYGFYKLGILNGYICK
jgi:hypothetical protein